MAGLSITTKNPLEFITVAARVDNVITSSMVMADIKFAVRLSVCLSVCPGRISSKTAERMSLKFCTEVCPGHFISHFGDDRPRGAKNVM